MECKQKMSLKPHLRNQKMGVSHGCCLRNDFKDFHKIGKDNRHRLLGGNEKWSLQLQMEGNQYDNGLKTENNSVHVAGYYWVLCVKAY